MLSSTASSATILLLLLSTLLPLSSAATSSSFKVPDDFSLDQVLQKQISSLSPSHKNRFFAEQAKLRKLVPDYDALEKKWANSNPSKPPKKVPAKHKTVKAEVPKSNFKRDEEQSLEVRDKEDKLEAMFEEAKRQAKRQTTKPDCTPLTGWTAPNIKGKGNTQCLSNTPTELIGEPGIGLKVGSDNAWAEGVIPTPLRGVFYMEGNPLPSEVFSTGTAYLNTTTQTWDMPAWQPGTWASDSNWLGRAEHELFRAGGVIFKNRCALNSIDGQSPKDFDGKNATTYDGQVICRTDQFITFLDIPFSFGQYWAYQVDPNYAIRTTLVRILKLPDGTYTRWNYNLWRIIDENGEKTEYYTTRYLANINKFFGYNRMPFVHLKLTTYNPL